MPIWDIVIFGNIIGGIVFVFFIASLAPKLGIFNQETMISIATHVIENEYWLLFLSAILAGWLMGLLTWLLNSTILTLNRIVIMFTATIGFVGFYHSIVGNIEVFGAFLFADNISLADYLLFLVLTLLGNGIGGAIVVGLFKYRIFELNFEYE